MLCCPVLRQEAPAVTPPQPAAAAPGGAEGDEAPKPKAKNPLDLLPPSPMVLDAWKRLYSNTKAAHFREVAIKGKGAAAALECWQTMRSRGSVRVLTAGAVLPI